MLKRKTSTADPADMPEAQIVTVRHATGSDPAMLIDGDAPEKGAKFAARLPNGKIYTGTVANTEDRDGKTLVTFRDGITPQD